MKNMTISLLCLFSAMLVHAQKTVINDPNVELRQVQPFSAISISNGIDVYLSQGEEDKVAVSASEVEYREKIGVTVENGVLKIRFRQDGWNMKSGNMKLKAYISFRSIGSLALGGGSDVYVNGVVSGDSLRITLSGGSDFRGNVSLNTLYLVQSGASDATISGKVGNLQVHASGASDLKGYALGTENCTATATGASDIQVSVNKTLAASASGASSIYYKGAGVVTDVRSIGASSVSKKG